MSVKENTVVSVYGDFSNSSNAHFQNDGDVSFKQNFRNDGVVAFNDNQNGYTRFTGSKTQNIEGTAESQFKNVHFLNTNSSDVNVFNIRGNIAIDGMAMFEKGILNNRDFGGAISFGLDAANSLASDLSFVNGDVYKAGKSDFTFPIGANKSYRPFIITGLDNEKILNAMYSPTNSDALYPHAMKEESIELIENNEYWVVDKDKADNAAVFVSLSWSDDVSPSEIISDTKKIGIVKWNVQDKKWIAINSSSDPQNKIVTAVVKSDAKGVFALAKIKSVESTLQVFNAVSPNNDGVNDYLKIDNIEKYPYNTVEVYNRWGARVFKTNNYNSFGNVFNGYMHGKGLKVGTGKLPAGTYFYLIEYGAGADKKLNTQSGYLYLSE
ncbi:gliding motility-associated C-terminal domain-containing protein [Flavobacterium poyangense]|uniref:gliding motility-associated C-terminal domain-containing protein n=1 Tax=Flavobacterium poyangense TaxID=2204302 RepID=UPI00141FD27B|nr:gliding motility-associated C-terminal domain-containing protein [Flavobacterium sp. JXAS1]